MNIKVEHIPKKITQNLAQRGKEMKTVRDVKETSRTLLENVTSITRVPKEGNKKKQRRGNI